MRLRKSHGLGNDYLILERWAPSEPTPSPDRALTAAQARLLCDRHRGPGGDGVLEPVRSARATMGLRIWNPDGSLAEKSGNGLRIFARWLVEHRGAPPVHTVEVAAGLVRCEVQPEAVSVEMGRATFAPEEVPAQTALRMTPVEVCGQMLPLTCVGLGNPHCVVFVDAPLDDLPWRAWGQALERHPLFPNRTNVQIARVSGPADLEARVWERGAGETASSGSSACAVAAAARALGLATGQVRVHMPGGALEVRVGEGYEITLVGPVEEVGEIRLSDALVKKLMVIG